MKIGLIPARGGSKGIPKKNLVDLMGKPLIQHTIEAALKSQLDLVAISSDDDEILQTAKSNNQIIAIKRPEDLSTDTSNAVDVMLHAIQSIKNSHAQNIDCLCYLQPTSPFRTEDDINQTLNLFDTYKADTIVSVTEVPHNFSPQSLMTLNEAGELKNLYSDQQQILRRQEKPVLYARNGPAILIIRPSYLKESKALYSGKVVPYIMPENNSLDIDTMQDLEIARAICQYKENKHHD